MRGGIFVTTLAFACLTRAQKDEHGEKNRSDPLVDPNFYIDQLKAIKEKASSVARIIPSKIPVVLDNDHTDGNWTSINSTDTCSYVEQSDGSILINTMHQYYNRDYCHEYWECENPSHRMFFKWNRVQLEQTSGCRYDWARFALGMADHQQEFICDENFQSKIFNWRQKHYRDTGGIKIVWDFDTDDSITRWGVEAQIICKDPRDVNECIDGTHDCATGAECVKKRRVNSDTLVNVHLVVSNGVIKHLKSLVLEQILIHAGLVILISQQQHCSQLNGMVKLLGLCLKIGERKSHGKMHLIDVMSWA